MQMIQCDAPVHVFPAKAGTHFCHVGVDGP